MEKTGSIEIRITGSKGNLPLSPEHYDVRELIPMLENIQDLLFPESKRNRPVISYKMEKGSVRNIFHTSLQSVIAFNAIMAQINKTKTIDFLEAKTAKAFENIQNEARKKNYVFFITTSIEPSNEIRVDKTTQFYRAESLWGDAEFYFYGKVTNAGGKIKANIHLSTEEFGVITIETPQGFLKNYKDNILYKYFGIRVKAKQNFETGELDHTTLKFIELIDYQPAYDESYLKRLRQKAKDNWLSKVDSTEWLREIRGYEA